MSLSNGNSAAALSKPKAGPGRFPYLTESAMSGSILRLVRSGGGWQLLDDEQPVFWFPERGKGLEIAQLMADARSLNHGLAITVEAQTEDGEFETVASYR